MSEQQVVEFNGKLAFDDFIFDFASQSLDSSSGRIELSPKPGQILAFLLQHAGELVTREQIAKAVWDEQVVDFDQNINFGIKQIRRALDDDPKQPRYVETIPKRGYRFIATVAPVTDKVVPVPSRKRGVIVFSIVFVAALSLTALIGFKTSEGFNSAQTTYAASPELNQTIQRAIYLYEQGGGENFKLSTNLFEKALQQEPDLAAAHAGLVLVKLFYAQNQQARQRVRHHLNKAIELGGDEFLTRLAQAKVAFYYDWDMATARAYFEQALALQNQSIPVLHDLAVVAVIQGDMQVAEESIQLALNIDPGRFQEHYHAGWFYMIAGNYERALKQCSESLEIVPDYSYSLLCAGRSAMKMNLTQTSAHYLKRFMQQAKASASEIEAITQAVELGSIQPFNLWYIQWLENEYGDPFELALAYAEAGDERKAIAALRQAVNNKHFMVPTAWAFDEFKPLRDKAEFEQLLQPVKI